MTHHWIRYLPDIRGSQLLHIADLINTLPHHAALEAAALAYAEKHWSLGEIAEAKRASELGEPLNVVEQMSG